MSETKSTQPLKVQGGIVIISGPHRLDLDITLEDGKQQEFVLLTVSPDVTLRKPQNAILLEWLNTQHHVSDELRMLAFIAYMQLKQTLDKLFLRSRSMREGLTPIEVIQTALDEHLAPITEVENTIKQAVGAVQTDQRLPRLPDGIAALGAIIIALVVQYPGKGYEAWHPPYPGGVQGPRWAEAEKELRQYWDSHTGFRE